MDVLQQLETLVDRADDGLALAEDPYLPPERQLHALVAALDEIRDGIREVHEELGGEDVWE